MKVDYIVGFSLGCIVILCAAVGNVCYDMGRLHERTANMELMIKHRCLNGVVFRKENGYWVDTRQACKPLEEVK